MKNNYIKRVTAKAITYTDVFKRIFIKKNQSGKFPKEIFEECGLNIEILGINRIRASDKG
ncbi:HTH domain-containing protein [Clostridium ganghwense]|uniref:HTH domain-containing protein n=1 Tax=Clostridium ganghwense TaxID=312089 RepID=UPI00300E58BC